MIRRAKIEDIEAINRLHEELVKDESINYNKLLKEKSIIKDIYNDKYNKEDKLLLVAEENNIIVGYIYGLIVINPIYKEKYVKLDALYVKEEYRNNKIGENLIKELIEWSKKNKINNIMVSVMSNNIVAKKLYEKYGFNAYKEVLLHKINI